MNEMRGIKKTELKLLKKCTLSDNCNTYDPFGEVFFFSVGPFKHSVFLAPAFAFGCGFFLAPAFACYPFTAAAGCTGIIMRGGTSTTSARPTAMPSAALHQIGPLLSMKGCYSHATRHS